MSRTAGRQKCAAIGWSGGQLAQPLWRSVQLLSSWQSVTPNSVDWARVWLRYKTIRRAASHCMEDQSSRSRRRPCERSAPGRCAVLARSSAAVVIFTSAANPSFITDVCGKLIKSSGSVYCRPPGRGATAGGNSAMMLPPWGSSSASRPPLCMRRIRCTAALKVDLKQVSV